MFGLAAGIRFTMATMLAACGLSAQPLTYIIQPAQSNRLELHVAKTGLYRGKVHVFLFPDYQGTLLYDAGKPQASQMRLSLKAGSIKLTDTWLSAKDFKEVQRYSVEEMLDAKKHPEITFVSTQIDKGSDAAHFAVHGTLAIRGVAKPAVVRVALEPGEGRGGVKLLRFRGDATVKLTDYGLKPPKALLGTIGTQDEMAFSFVFDVVPAK
jgi:polyisoprenoid-binding protein YceI